MRVPGLKLCSGLLKSRLVLSGLVPLLLTGCGAGINGSFSLPSGASVAVAPVGHVAAPTCVTFIGDSLTAAWPMSNLKDYDGGCYVNHGIGGTTMPQILDGIDDHSLPYDASVDASTSRIVVIGGDAFNSLRLGLSLQQIEDAYTAVFAKLQAMGVQPVLCTVLPSYNGDWNAQTIQLNAWMKAQATQLGLPLMDIYATPPLVGSDGTLNPPNTTDGIHLTKDSYAYLTEPVEAAIAEAAKKL